MKFHPNYAFCAFMLCITSQYAAASHGLSFDKNKPSETINIIRTSSKVECTLINVFYDSSTNETGSTESTLKRDIPITTEDFNDGDKKKYSSQEFDIGENENISVGFRINSELTRDSAGSSKARGVVNIDVIVTEKQSEITSVFWGQKKIGFSDFSEFRAKFEKTELAHGGVLERTVGSRRYSYFANCKIVKK